MFAVSHLKNPKELNWNEHSSTKAQQKRLLTQNSQISTKKYRKFAALCHRMMLCTFCFSKGKLDVISSMKQVHKSSGPVCVLLRSPHFHGWKLFDFHHSLFSLSKLGRALSKQIVKPPREDGNALRGKIAVSFNFFSSSITFLANGCFSAVNLLPNPSTHTIQHSIPRSALVKSPTNHRALTN